MPGKRVLALEFSNFSGDPARSFAPSELARGGGGLRPRRVCPFSEVAPPFQKSWIRPCIVYFIVFQRSVTSLYCFFSLYLIESHAKSKYTNICYALTVTVFAAILGCWTCALPRSCPVADVEAVTTCQCAWTPGAVLAPSAIN
jgi:hypothetical protein